MGLFQILKSSHSRLACPQKNAKHIPFRCRRVLIQGAFSGGIQNSVSTILVSNGSDTDFPRTDLFHAEISLVTTLEVSKQDSDMVI